MLGKFIITSAPEVCNYTKIKKPQSFDLRLMTYFREPYWTIFEPLLPKFEDGGVY